MTLFSVLHGYIWLLGTFVNSSCDININMINVKLLYKLGSEICSNPKDCSGHCFSIPHYSNAHTILPNMEQNRQ